MDTRNNLAGGYLQKLRRAALLTQRELARRAQVSHWRLCVSESEGIDLRPVEQAALRRVLAHELTRTVAMVWEFQANGDDVAVSKQQ